MSEEWSFTKKAKLKEYKYIVYDIFRRRVEDRVVYAKNELAFLRFLDEMNSSRLYSKYHSHKDWSMYEEIDNILKRKYKNRNMEEAIFGEES